VPIELAVAVSGDVERRPDVQERVATPTVFVQVIERVADTGTLDARDGHSDAPPYDATFARDDDVSPPIHAEKFELVFSAGRSMRLRIAQSLDHGVVPDEPLELAPGHDHATFEKLLRVDEVGDRTASHENAGEDECADPHGMQGKRNGIHGSLRLGLKGALESKAGDHSIINI